MFCVTAGLLLTVVTLIYSFLTWNFSYWKKLSVNGPKPQLLLGNYPNLFSQKRSMAYDLDEIYRKYKKDEDFVGIYSSRSPQLLITSPALARRVYVTDFKHFHDNEASQMVDSKSDFIFANNPFSLTGEEWKERRAEVTPGLTLGRVKTVYPVTNKICKKMTEYIKKQNRVTPKDGIDGKDISLRFTSEVVTDCVLGLNADSFSEKPTPILGMIQNLFENTVVLIFYMAMIGLFPLLKRFYKVRIIPKRTEKFFVDLMQNAIDMRKQQTQSQDRVDFLNYMLQLQEKKNLSTLQLTAHTMTFLLDGFETTASVLSHCLLMLARHPLILEKVRSEFEGHVGKDGVVDFDALVELPFLDACIHESLRMFPPGFVTNKICTEPIELTNKNGRTLRVPKGEIITMPLYSFMMDEDYYSNPQEFQPERFLEENGGVKKYRESGVFFGFGDGPRVCLGMRFALAQTKAAIVELLTNFNIRVNPKTRNDNTLDPKYFLSRLDGGIWLDFEDKNSKLTNM